nr:peptidoglycan DD-metalloendopeptidase family protein [Ameyamaea chiangmaiensis]
MSDRVAALRTEDASLSAAIARDAEALRPMLPLVERLSLYPADTLLAAPVEPTRAISGLMVLRGLSKGLEQRAETMRARQARLTEVRATLEAQSQQLEGLSVQQTQQRDAVAAQARMARDAQTRSTRAAQAMASAVQAASRQAGTLQSAIDRLDTMETALQQQLDREAEAARRAHRNAEAAASVARAHAASPGTGVQSQANDGRGPVAGSVLTAWGASTDAGPASGITYAAAPGGNVRAPCTGRVDFAGDFRSYGQMVILDCGQHYRFVLAGLGSLGVDSGQAVARGASVGVMPGTSARRPALFVQLRHGRETVDPRPFL